MEPLLEDSADSVYMVFKENLFCSDLFLDVPETLDYVNHDISLDKLNKLGIRCLFLALVQSYLSVRSQLVSVGQHRSMKIFLKAGVPQGSFLSPFLFNINTDDLSNVITRYKILQHVDDTLHLYSHVNYDAALSLFQRDVTCVTE